MESPLTEDEHLKQVQVFRLLTKKEKTWFFLLCSKQPKINELIFLIVIGLPMSFQSQNKVCP